MSRIKNPLVDPLLSVVMPVFNEKATIEEIQRALSKGFRIPQTAEPSSAQE